MLPPVDSPTLTRAEEALDRGIAHGAAHRTHAADPVVASQDSPAFVAGTLAAKIRVQHHSRLILTLPQGHQYSLDTELAVGRWLID